MPKYNKFKSLPYMGFNIVTYLFNNENIWKLLKYDDYDCLDKPNLSQEEKTDLIWRGQEDQSKYNIFLTSSEIDSITDSRSVLRIFDYSISPESHLMSTVCFKFNIICIGKSSMINYNGIPCNRATVIKSQLLETLNGEYIGGVGKLIFDDTLSRWCGSMMDLGSSKNSMGDSMIMAVKVSDLEETKCQK